MLIVRVSQDYEGLGWVLIVRVSQDYEGLGWVLIEYARIMKAWAGCDTMLPLGGKWHSPETKSGQPSTPRCLQRTSWAERREQGGANSASPRPTQNMSARRGGTRTLT